MPARKSSSTPTPTRRAAKPAPAKATPAKAVAKPVPTKPAPVKAASAKAAPAKAALARPASAKAPAGKAAPALAKATPPLAKPASAPKPAPAVVEAFTDKDQKRFETRLLEERARLLKELGYLEANVLNKNPRDSSGDLSGYSFHMADAGTDAMEREKAFLFASAEGRALHDVDEALRRLYKGEYGMCESCGNPIAAPRLEVVPHARLCIKCKEREEKAGRR